MNSMLTFKGVLAVAILTFSTSVFASTTVCQLKEINIAKTEVAQQDFVGSVNGKLYADLIVETEVEKNDSVAISILNGDNFLGRATGNMKTSLHVFLNPGDDSQQVIVDCDLKK